MSNICFSKSSDLDRPNAWHKKKEQKVRFGGLENWFLTKDDKHIKKALKHMNSAIKDIKQNKFIRYEDENLRLKKSQAYIDKEILKNVSKYPKTNFILILPPYSRMKFAILVQYKKSDYTIYKKNIKYLVSKSDEFKNLKIYSWGNYDFVDDISIYKDPTHYHQSINSWMLNSIKQDEGLLLSENIDNYIDIFTKKALEFNLTEIGYKIDRYLNK